MKTPLLIVSMAIMMASCSTTKKTEANPNLPKDISERPANEDSQKYDQAQLDKMRTEIEAEAGKEKCTEATVGNWKFAAMGAKSCGGPKYYITYPTKIEASILPKIEAYNNKEKEFNTKYDIMSDCTFVSEPTSIKCVNGKAEAVYN